MKKWVDIIMRVELLKNYPHCQLHLLRLKKTSWLEPLGYGAEGSVTMEGQVRRERGDNINAGYFRSTAIT